MDEPPTDASLIREALAEPSRFAEIFDRHYDAICDYLLRRLPVTVAEEVASETFLIAFRQRSSFNFDYASARPWLFGIATNLLGRHRRDERRRVAAYSRSLPTVSPDPADEIDGRADASRAHAALARALAELADEDRDVMLLLALADLSYPEIASALGIRAGTVKSRLHRARRQLASALEPEGVKPNG